MERGLVSFLFVCAISGAVCYPLVPKVSEHLLRANTQSNEFSVADKNGDGFLDVNTEFIEFLNLRAAAKAVPEFALEDLQSMNKHLAARLHAKGVRRVSRAEAESDELQVADASKAKQGWLFSPPAATPSAASVMTAGCNTIVDYATQDCAAGKLWTPLKGTTGLTCAATREDGGTVIRGTVVINKGIDAVMTAVKDRTKWKGAYDSKLTKVTPIRSTDDGEVIYLKWEDSTGVLTSSGEAVIREKWCTTTGDARVGFAVSTTDSAAPTSLLTVDIDVKAAGIYLKKISSSQTELTYISKASVSWWPFSYTPDAAKHEAVSIPKAIKAALEASA